MNSDRWLALMLLALGATYGYAASLFTTTALGDPVGPSAFPLVLASFLVFFSLLLLIKPGPASFGFTGKPFFRLGAVLLSLLGFVVLVEWLGFIITTIVTMTTLALIFQGPRWVSLLCAVIFGVATYVIFDLGLGLSLPAGSLFGW